jgi:hypothetical protein
MSIKVMSEVWANSAATGTTLLVQLALADHADDEKRSCFPAIGYIAKKCRVGESTARRHIHELQNLGELRIEIHGGGTWKHGSQRPNLYVLSEYLLIPPVNLTPGDVDKPPVNLTPPVTRDTPPPVRFDTHPLSPVTPEPSTNHQLNQQQLRERCDECVNIIAQERSSQSWVSNPKAVKSATVKKLRGIDKKPLESWLADHPDTSDADVAGSYLRNEIPGTEDYQMQSDGAVTPNASKSSPYDPQQAAQRRLRHETERDRILKALATVSDPLDIAGLEADLAALDGRGLKAMAS